MAFPSLGPAAGRPDGYPRPGRRRPELVLSDTERAELTRSARRARATQFLALWARIVLRCADGGTNKSSTSSVCTTTRPRMRWSCGGMRGPQIQALDHSQPVLPTMPGAPEHHAHDYYRHGFTSLLASFNIADGSVISELHRRHRAVRSKCSWFESASLRPSAWM